MPTIPDTVTSPPLVRIQPTYGWRRLDLGELWVHRELLYFLAWRDIKLRYRQTALGVLWVVLQPVLTMGVFTVFFGALLGVSSDGMPYPLFSLGGLLAWTFFARAVLLASESVVGQAHLITKVYFPRLVMPLATVIAGLVDLAIGLVVLSALMVGYGTAPGIRIIWLPGFLVFLVAASLGTATWLAALNVRYRDVRHVIPFVVQTWMFVTPVIYPASVLRSHLAAFGLPEWLVGLNPLAGIVEGFRWTLVGAAAPPLTLLAASASVSLGLLLSGVAFFRRTERSFADVV